MRLAVAGFWAHILLRSLVPMLEGIYFRQPLRIIKWQVFVTDRSMGHPISLRLFLILVTLLLISTGRFFTDVPSRDQHYLLYAVRVGNLSLLGTYLIFLPLSFSMKCKLMITATLCAVWF